MIWTEESAKFYLLGAISTMPPLVNEAMAFYSTKFDENKNLLELAITTLKNLGLDTDTFIKIYNALNFLKKLPSLPLTYTEDEKNFIEELNVAVSILRQNSAVWLCIQDLPHEIWRDVVGYEGLYQVSNYGRLKSFYGKKGKILAGKFDAQGYSHCALAKNKVAKMELLHRIIAQTFLPNPENNSVVHHKDHDKMNSCVWNLQWTTHSQNILYAFQSGIMKNPSGVDSHNSKLTAEQVRWIRENYIRNDKKFGAPAFAKYFGVTVGTIYNVVYRRAYKNVE